MIIEDILRAHNARATNIALGDTLLRRGEIESAFYLAVEVINDGDDTVAARSLFVRSAMRLRHVPIITPSLLRTLVRAISEPWCRPLDLADLCVGIIRQSGVINDFETGCRDALLLALLKSTVIPDVEVERFLTECRRALLEQVSTIDVAPQTCLDFLCALAQHCYINGYAFAQTEKELEQAMQLSAALNSALSSGANISGTRLAAVACYIPLHTLPSVLALLETQWPEPLDKLILQQVREPLEEADFRKNIPSLTSIDDDISLVVREQYESFPYPFWTKTALSERSISLTQYLHERFPLASINNGANRNGLDILIAGCGTGQQVVETATLYSGARILAIDLSLSSLAYAQRKSHELGLRNIEYAQADLLKIEEMGRTFDVVISTGVLHHLADPFAGWESLLSILRPAGFMKLALYSREARRGHDAIASFIAEEGYRSTRLDIRRFRHDVMSNRRAELRLALTKSDFFGLNTCRDLFFHAHERTMTIRDIRIFIKEHRLCFLGFDPEPNNADKFKRQFTYRKAMTDLNAWHQFELEHPDTFNSMYRFWIQKPDQGRERQSLSRA